MGSAYSCKGDRKGVRIVLPWWRPPYECYDIFLLYGYTGVRFKWVMKVRSQKYPFRGVGVRKIGFIFVDNTPSGAKRVGGGLREGY